MRSIAFLLILMLGAVAHAQIEVAPESPVYTPIPVSVVSTVPDGAKVEGPGWVWPEGVNKVEIGPNKFIVCAPPGEYVLEYHLEWLHIVPVTFIDGSGKEITIQSYLGSGKLNYTAKFKVVGGTPPVPPPVPTPGSKWGLLLRETKGGQDPALGNLLIQLRLKFQNNKLVIHDPTTVPDRLKPLIPSGAQTVLMVLVRQADGTDKLVKVVPVSDTTTVADVEKELQ